MRPPTVHAEGIIQRTPRCKAKTATLVTKQFTAVTCPACLAIFKRELERR